MKTLAEIVKSVSVVETIGSLDTTISALQMDSRKVKQGDCFIAVKGTSSDGHAFIAKCIEQGAVAIVCEIFPAELTEGVTYIRVQNSSKALGLMASSFYDNPSGKMKVVGVTGTNGKTSCVTLLFRLYRAIGANVGLLSTVQNQINEEIIPSTHTTPDAIALNA